MISTDNETPHKQQMFCYLKFICIHIFFPLWHCDPTRVMASSFLRFLDRAQRTTVGRTPLDEWSARRGDLYLTTHQHSQQTNIDAPGGIRTHDLSWRAAADLRLRPRGHWDRHMYTYIRPENSCLVRSISQQLSMQCHMTKRATDFVQRICDAQHMASNYFHCD